MSNASAFVHKPELALRRALELQSIRQDEAALLLLQEVLSSRRHRTWSLGYEQLMMAYLDLCLKSNQAREAKDGLHQYRNLAQAQAPGSLEKVIRYLMEQAEKKCSQAKALAVQLAAQDAAAGGGGDDEDGGGGDDDEDDNALGASPQSILLSTMSTDPAAQQRDSLVVLPALKFLWETYRAILDILRSNSKLERVYHAAARGALNFCSQYKRRIEFRRLCDMLRLHLGNLQKYGVHDAILMDGSSKQSNKVRGWEGWTTESIELHLQTRFCQLETASALKLYTEGFRTVEDIYNILQISHARRRHNPNLPPPKAKLMAAYYEKLTTLFWVSENYLFHAFASYKYHVLCTEFHKAMDESVAQEQASAVLLAALCIPSAGAKQEKMARMATLLGFYTKNPTRQALLEEIQSTGILQQVPDYLQELYQLLEKDSNPLTLIAQAKPLLDRLAQESKMVVVDEETKQEEETSLLAKYVQPLKSVLLLKLLFNLSAVYQTVQLDHLHKLVEGLEMPWEWMEASIVGFAQTHVSSFCLKLDHRSGCLRFGAAEWESPAVRSQLTVLATKLQGIAVLQQQTGTAKEAEQARNALFDHVRATRDADHAAILDRKAKIEHRKEEVERLAQEEAKRLEEKKRQEEAIRKRADQERMQQEQKMREQEKLKKIQQEMENTRKQQLLKSMGRQDVDNITEEELNQMDAAKLEREHQAKIQKEKDEAEQKTRAIAKRLDYLVRAVRIEELPLIKKKYEEKVKNDREQYEKEIQQKSEKARKQWEADKMDKSKLSEHSIFEHMSAFQDKVMEGRRLQHIVLCRQADADAELQADQAKMDRARKRKQDEERRKQEEEARLVKEEEERLARERVEEARRVREQAEEERRRAEDARMAQERQRKEQQTAATRTGRASSSLDQLASRSGGGGSSKYVPPSRRGGDTGGGGGGGSRFGGGGGGSRFGDRDRYAGGGRYEGRGGGASRDGDGPPFSNSRWKR